MGIIYDALTIAKWIINKIHPEPLKLQKLLYLAQGYSYAFYDRPLFKDDLEGWVHGPVVRNVYDIFKNYQYNSIDTNFEVEELDDEAKDIINYVIVSSSASCGRYDVELKGQVAKSIGLNNDSVIKTTKIYTGSQTKLGRKIGELPPDKKEEFKQKYRDYQENILKSW